MAQATADTPLQRSGETEDEHSPERFKVQDRAAGVTFETKDFKVTAGCLAGHSESSGTSSDGAGEDGQEETYFSVSLSPRGVRTSRKRLRKKSRQSPTLKKMKTTDVREEALIPAKSENTEAAAQAKNSRAEVAQEVAKQCASFETIRIVLLALFVFVIFMHLTMMVVVTICS